MDWLVFGLAYVGYALVCADVSMRAWRRKSRIVTAAAAVVILAHVALVWIVRFEGSLDVALSKGAAGFAIFHVALALIVAASLAPEPWSGRAMFTAFPIVTLGALGAAFKYDYVAVLRLPLIAAFGAAIAAIVLARRWA